MSRQEKEQNPSTSFHPSNLFNMVENQNCQEAVILTATLSKEALRHTKLKYDSYGLEIVHTANNLLYPGDKVIHHQIILHVSIRVNYHCNIADSRGERSECCDNRS